MESVHDDIDMPSKIAGPIAKKEKNLYECMHVAIIEPWQRRPDWDLSNQIERAIKRRFR